MSLQNNDMSFRAHRDPVPDDGQCAEMMRALMRGIPDLIYFKDRQGRYVSVSNAYAAYFNTTIEEMVGRTDVDFLSAERAEESCVEDRRIMETGDPVVDRIEKRRHLTGYVTWLSVTKAPWRDSEEEIKGVVGVCREVTDRVERERYILDMLSIATHDIRGPLVSIGSTIKLLVRGAFGQVDESVKVTLSDISGRMKHLERIVSEYLCKSSFMNVSAPQKEHLDLRQDIIDPILDEFSQDIEESNIRIDNRLGAIPVNRIIINANIQWIRIVYRNLIRNAIKYAPSGVIAFGFEDQGDHYRLNVYNSGPPVAQENRTKIFDRFQSEGGTGLGLAISRNLIIKHGGDMWYESTWDDHPNFVFTIPK